MLRASRHIERRGPIAGDLLRLNWLAKAQHFQLALHRHALALKAGFNPDQPRDELGRWTDAGAARNAEPPRSDGVIVSDATDDPVRAGDQYAQSGPRGPYSGRGPILINGQLVQPTPAQSAILAVVEARANSAIRRVQDIFPNWRPTASWYNTVEGRIATARAEAEQAEARASEFQNYGILPGLFARESIPARGPERNFNLGERKQVNEIGSIFGCHTCGTFNSGIRSGNYFCDHQIPSALNQSGQSQRLFPQCMSCSGRQGNWIRNYRRSL